MDYLVIRNNRDGDDFSYLESTEPGQRFLKAAKPTMIEMEARVADIQRELDNRGLSLRQAIECAGGDCGTFAFRAARSGCGVISVASRRNSKRLSTHFYRER
jgi:hypothetical protein